MFNLSVGSLGKLEGVNPRLVNVVKRAIQLTTVDFGVLEGLRTISTQKKYVAAGKSQTMQSLHIEGKAVDLIAYVGTTSSWELNLYDDIAAAMRKAAIEQGIGIRWGGAWIVDDIRTWNGTMESAMNHYVDYKRKRGERAFIDAPHFELS